MVCFKEEQKLLVKVNLNYHISVSSEDEIGQLARAFNKMVDDLKNLQVQIVQMDRMSSIGQLAGGIAHEINNPLVGVLGNSQILLERMPTADPLRPLVERIERASQRCRKIVKSLLDFSREKDYIFHKIDLNNLIDDTLDFCLTELSQAKINVVKKYLPLSTTC